MDRDEYFTCPICQDPPHPDEAVQCRGCRTVFCHACIEEWSRQSRLCSHCRERHGYCEADKAIQRVLGDIRVECPYECGSTTTKSELSDHCRLCPKRDGRFDFTKANAKKPKQNVTSKQSGASTSAEQDQCEIGDGALFAAAVGGALIGVVGGAIGAWLLGGKEKKK